MAIPLFFIYIRRCFWLAELINLYKLTMDIKTVQSHVVTPVVIQHDNVRFEIEVLDGGEPFDLSQVTDIQFVHKRPDGSIIAGLGAIEGNKITYDYVGSETDIVGNVETSFSMINGNEKVSVRSFYVVVQKDLLNGELTPVTPGYSALQDVIVEVQELDSTIKELREEAILGSVITPSEESAPLGANLITDTSAWVLGQGWSGNASSGFAHTVGNTEPLTYPLNAEAGKIYQVTLTVDDTDTMNSGFKFNVSIGNSLDFQLYKGVGGTIVYSRGIRALENGPLVIKPLTDFTGVVSGISVQEVTGVIPATSIIRDSSENVVLEARPTAANLNNVFLGKRVGQMNTNGDENTAIGHGSLENNVSGFWNSAVGFEVMQNNINGSRNVGVGRWSLRNLVSGHRNIALGTFALHRVTTGAYNIGIGADSGWYTTSGSYNIAIGTVSLDKNTTGSQNIAIGYNALRDNLTTSNNVGIGHHALRLNANNNNTAVGSFAMAQSTGSGAVAVGYQALNLSTGINNTVIGQQAANVMVGGNSNTMIGRTVALSLTNGTSNTLIGQSSMRNAVTGSRNTIIGDATAATLFNGNGNIIIGNAVDVPMPETSNYLNIGNLIYGDLSTKRIGIGLDNPLAKLHIGAGSATVPALRINNGVLLTTPMNGALEFSGGDLYITANGVRRRILTEVAT